MKICVINHQDTKPWLLEKHYAKRMPNIVQAYGGFEDGILKGVITFGIPASHHLCIGVCGEEYKDRVWELNRLCVDESASFQTSQFVAGALKRLNHLFSNGKCGQSGRVIVSYADTKWGHYGKIYQATNFLYTGCTKERLEDYSEHGHSRHGDSTKKQIRSPKHRYITFVGNRGFKRYARKALKYEILPYPEGESQRYDASFKPESQSIFNL